jgi:hypothetical protein
LIPADDITIAGIVTSIRAIQEQVWAFRYFQLQYSRGVGSKVKLHEVVTATATSTYADEQILTV